MHDPPAFKVLIPCDDLLEAPVGSFECRVFPQRACTLVAAFSLTYTRLATWVGPASSPQVRHTGSGNWRSLNAPFAGLTQ